MDIIIMDTPELEEVIENEYGENDDELDEFFDDDLEDLSDILIDDSLPESSSNVSECPKSDQEEMDEYLEDAWRQMEIEVEAELRRKEAMKTEEESDQKQSQSSLKKKEGTQIKMSNAEKQDSLVNLKEINEELTLNEASEPAIIKTDASVDSGVTGETSENQKEVSPTKYPPLISSDITETTQSIQNSEIESLPKGYKVDSSTNTIVSPGGQHYNSRVEAFQQMCNQPGPGLRAEMFDTLVFEGFQAHPLLAPGWIFRQENDQLCFLDFNGTLLHSLEVAQSYFQEFCSEEEYKNFEKFILIISEGNLNQAWVNILLKLQKTFSAKSFFFRSSNIHP